MAGALGYRFSGRRWGAPDELRSCEGLSNMAGSLAFPGSESQSRGPASPCSPLAALAGIITP
jgi:hypothetical protein